MAAAARPKRKAPKNRLPEPLPVGFVVNDPVRKSQWVIGTEIGSGGFGRVYLANNGSSKQHDYVLKVEFHGNGPLFSEIHCYQCFGRPSQIAEWTRKMKLGYLGLSPAYGFGSFEYKESKYRFLVIERYGTDLNEIIKKNGCCFSLKNAYSVGISVLNILEYIHSYGYLHLDIKAANLLLGRKKGTENQVYLVDMGLATKFITNGEHRKDIPDPKKSHNGTIEYMSRDAHNGTPCTRRADLETLSYNLLYWLCGKLPWEQVTDCVKVYGIKQEYMSDIKKFMKVMFPDNVPPGIMEFIKYVQNLTFDETPNYDLCRKMLINAIASQGFKFDGKLNFSDKKVDRPLSDASSSAKENVKVGKVKTVEKKSRRKQDKPLICLAEGITPTPAMLAILNKNK